MLSVGDVSLWSTMNLTELLTNGSLFFNSTFAPLNGSSCDSLYRKWGIVKILAIHRPMVATVDKFVTPVWYAIGFPGNLLAFIVWIQVRKSSGDSLQN